MNTKVLSFGRHSLIGMHSLSGLVLWYDLGENNYLMGVIDPDIFSPSFPPSLSPYECGLVHR